MLWTCCERRIVAAPAATQMHGFGEAREECQKHGSEALLGNIVHMEGDTNNLISSNMLLKC